ncbi:3-carboxymuconate cyclase [Sorangium cellulosum]|uniref:3-carboxymuconate cyclase n=1 Tax=Sorangium cellulosum TaxID=56 RepID=A0A150TMI8_SORCE|nr:3-carboxymuconate cyclase [Sorangium cellulosum]
MFRSTMSITALSLGIFAASAPGDAMAHRAGVHRHGQVFVMTNAGDGNAVVAYDRDADGSLAYAGTYATGGLGAPSRPINPLGSQGSLVLSEDGKLLFAVNAGSNEVSMFRVGPHGLTLLDVVDSGGDFPVSVASHGGLLYVLNVGGDGNIAGFEVDPCGELVPMKASVRDLGLGGTIPPSLGATPGQIGFSPGGEVLVVAGKGSNQIHVFPVIGRGLPSDAPVTTISRGLVPFDFAFDRRGHLIVAEVGGDGVPATGDTSAVSSYGIRADGSLAVISDTVDTFQRATCWIAGAPGSRYVFTANTGSDTVSGLQVDARGALTLLDGGVSASFPAGTAPIDLTMTRDGRFLYTLNAGAGTIAAFQVSRDGSLLPRGEAGRLVPGGGAQGIAVR